jgi:hypothetical protein
MFRDLDVTGTCASQKVVLNKSMETRVQRPSPTVTERRRQYVKSALGSLRIEGLELDDQARAIVAHYVAGDFSREEMARTIRALR